MERKSSRRKRLRQHLRRRAKRYAAAVAGAAIMTGALLPGIPAAKALAAESPTNVPPISIEQTTELAKNTKKPIRQVVAERARNEDRNGPSGRGWHEHKYGWPSSDENQAWYQDGRIYYRSDNDRYRDRDVYYLSDPVDFAKDAAAVYGFDASLDSFTLLTVSSHKALVEVTKHDTGKLFNILLERTTDRDWRIVEVRAL